MFSVHSIQNSTMQSFGNKVRNMTHLGQPSIEIKLNNSSYGVHSNYVVSYSTMDTIEGTVSITANHDTRFEEVEIAFMGTAQVYVDRLTTTPSMSGRTEANHRFLTLKQPIADSQLPTPRVLESGRTYELPFTFTVPAQLLPRSCPHGVNNDSVRDSHLQLPPSMGDPELAGHGGSLLDDLAPEMSKIVYGIKVRLTQLRETDNSLSLLASQFKKVRVKPAHEEQPPINFDPSNGEYRLRMEKNVKKGLFKGKLGTLTAQSAQPKALMIPGARTTNDSPIATKAKIVLRFDPKEETILPPRLSTLSSKIRVSTYYASAPRHDIPTRSALGFDLTQGVYQENVTLSSLCIASASWVKHASCASPQPDDNYVVRRDSGMSGLSATSYTENEKHSAFTAGILTASPNYKGGAFYTAAIHVPVTLPTNKNFLPTFHSCLISRVYALSLHVAAKTPSGSNANVYLKVPVQIAAEGSEMGNENARARSAEVRGAREADAIFSPRSVAPPSLPPFSQGQDEADLPPPDYVQVAGQVGRRGQREGQRVSITA
ncbi:arrestin [Lophiostoma macrostomum CBS 122681]|uniref:Arrestin n=1 Tax=Lophiostoma macrostomum CBS 122681 TaxID=1314788 RepID=A0A6A6TSG6_9PLEO|nr:arrestin [Lophiostoma macrostomum CBS 122681]